MRGVVVVGASGLGKTRLATEVMQRAARQGAATLWAVATRAAASIPFGPLAHLLPDSGADASSRLDLLRHAGTELTGRAHGRRVVLGVDDAHLLDDASAALVHHLATTGTAFVVATVRSGEAAPDAVSALWKDGLAEWLELQPLSQAHVTRLVESVVGGPVEAGTLYRLSRLSVGNALFLRELVTAAVESGALVDVGGMWRAEGPLPASTRLVELVEARLGRLPREVRSVAEVIAVGEPLGAALLEAVVPPDDLEATDRAGLLQVVPDLRRTLVRLAHPLYAELLRAHLPPLRARTIPRHLASAMQDTGAKRRDDLLRLAVWQLEGGAGRDPRVLVPAARQALFVFFDPPLADRLAAAAVDSGGGFAARLAQAEAANALGRVEQAEHLLAELEPQAVGDADVARVAIVRADNLNGGLRRPADAEGVLDRADAAVTDMRWRDELAALRAGLAILAGQAERAVAIAAPVLDHPAVRPQVALRALAAAVASAAYRGRLDEVAAGSEHGIRIAGGLEADVSLPFDRLLTILSFAHRLAGELDEADRVSFPRYNAALDRRAGDVAAAWAMVIGEIAIARGDMTAAVRWFQDGAAGMREYLRVFGSHGLSWCLGGLAQAAAIAGRSELAERALAEAVALTPEAYYVPSLDLARVWSAASGGDVERGRRLALEAAERARSLETIAFEAGALHDAARLGAAGEVAGRLHDLAACVQGPIAPCYAEHAAALASGDAAALERASEAFERLGALLLAAEAAAAAARQHHAAGKSASARTAVSHARGLARRCGPVRTPGLALPDEPDLTPRERQVAERAARGLASRAIADELSLSVRTVDNHLRNAYAKLGVAGRDELAGVL